MFPLKPFQEKAVSKLKDKLLLAWKSDDVGFNITFKSPTGSGKTVMMAQLLQDIISDPRLTTSNKCFIWLAPKGLEMQSKQKLYDYYGGASELNLVDISDVNNGSMDAHDVLFVNWELLKASNAETRRLRRDPGEQGYSFDQYIENTHKKGLQIIVVMDEEHIGTGSILALELINTIVKPRIIIRVSATPQGSGGFMVEVPHSDVIEAGLIKEKVIFQTKEDLKSLTAKELDRDQELLELAYQKRLELVSTYKKLRIDINPLVLIQLPNDDQARRETENLTKEEVVIEYLKEKGISEDRIAIWLSKKKENLELVEKNDSPVEFLLFKQAAATGWDCPRASILVMFREIGNQTFHTQTIGRILRMPEAKYYPEPTLNRAYLFTNYERNKVLEGITTEGKDIQDRMVDLYTTAKPTVPVYQLQSTIMSRADYNDMGDTFQHTFEEVAAKELNIKDMASATKILKEKDFSHENASVPSEWIVGLELDNYDDFKYEALAEGEGFSSTLSPHDIQRLYNLLCFDIIAKQTDLQKKFAPERSWSKLKTALNVFFIKYSKLSRSDINALVVRDLTKADSVLRPIIGKALAKYRPIRSKEVEKKQATAIKPQTFAVPQPNLSYPGYYKEERYKKCAAATCYLSPSMVENEKDFIKYLEANTKVLYWLKNGDSGSESLAIPYYSQIEQKDHLFYPDWFIWTKKSLWIVDTKAGMTASDPNTKDKAEALYKYLGKQKNVKGGIVVSDGQNGWKINQNKIYTYSANLQDWDNLVLD